MFTLSFRPRRRDGVSRFTFTTAGTATITGCIAEDDRAAIEDEPLQGRHDLQRMLALHREADLRTQFLDRIVGHVAAVALQLVGEGRLGLDDPISKYLGGEPWFARLPNARDITVRMVMRMTARRWRPSSPPRVGKPCRGVHRATNVSERSFIY